MKHSELEKKLGDMEFEQRYNVAYAQHLLLLIPLLIYAAVTYWELGYFSLLALGLSASVYCVIAVILHQQVRSRTLAALRREGVVDENYEPPFG